MISECVELPADQISSETVGVINLRGEPLPYVRLTRGIRHTQTSVPCAKTSSSSIAKAAMRESPSETLLGECQAIIKPLNRIFRDVPGVSGSTILDDGRVALILDVEYAAARGRCRASTGGE